MNRYSLNQYISSCALANKKFDVRSSPDVQPLNGYSTSDVNKARTLKAKAKAMAILMQRLTMKYEVTKSCFFEYSYKATSTV